ncbi:MAG: hypothetical protein MUE73_12605 [Planctomycetes bacterium]|jgi:hypothetical protein|nr:hypothetical protein [Planctomycetota bacterium]
MDADPGRHGQSGRGFLLATVFCSGAAVMIVGKTAIRVLQPFFGSTTHLFTDVIAVVLAALPAGYAAGGRLADRQPAPPPPLRPPGCGRPPRGDGGAPRHAGLDPLRPAGV